MAQTMVTLVATCLFGLESLLGAEIDALGYERLSTIDGRVTFRGSLEAIARCNIWLRYAERLYLLLGTFTAESFTQLYDGCRALPWEDWIGPEDAFPVSGHALKSRLFSLPDCQKIVKKAVVDRLGAHYGIQWFPEEHAKYQIVFFILRDQADLMIDLSGTPLHKRGWRQHAGEAPLRETLAAAIARLARPRAEVLFWDPFCGSGTIAIEAALLMTNTAPGLGRSFAAESFDALPHTLFPRAREEARAARCSSDFTVYASDIDPDMVALAGANAARAGVAGQLHCFCQDALTIQTQGRRGTVVCNPPYGERMLDSVQAQILYRKMGAHFRTLDRWQIYILTADAEFERIYGRKADKRRRLYNGMLRCTLYQYFKNDPYGSKANPNSRERNSQHEKM